MSISDKLGHTVQRLKGHAEEDTGKALGDDDLVAHGKADQLAAHAKHAASQAGDAARHVASQAGDTARHVASQTGDAARHVGHRFTQRAMRRLGRLHQRLHEAAAEGALEEAEVREKQEAERS